MRRRRLISVGLALLVLASIFCTYTLVSQTDLSYGGYPLSYWILAAQPNGRGRGFIKAPEEARQALQVIGTNNLDLLVRRIAYDPEKSLRVRFLRMMPAKVARSTFWNFLWNAEQRHLHEVDDASECLAFLGPLAAPAVPQLKRIVETGGRQPAVFSLHAISSVGDSALPALISTACSTNLSLRIQAMMLLAPYTNRPAAFSVLTNALNDPDSDVRATAARALTGKLFE